MTLDDFVSRLKNPKPRTYKGLKGYEASCPAHDDKHASFFVWEGTDGWLHVKCQTGCTECDVERAMGLSDHDRCVDSVTPKNLKGDSVCYSYYDVDGLEAFAKVRSVVDGKKRFMQFVRFDAEGKPIKKVTTGKVERYPFPGEVDLNGRGKILYRLGEVLSATAKHNIVYVNEGEKAVEAFRIRGHVATCQPAGAGPGKWLKEHTDCIAGATVVIVADRDAPGEAYAKEVAAAVSSVCRSVRVVQSKTENPKDDAFDHFSAGYGVDDFVRRSDLEPPKNVSERRNAANVTESSVEWLAYPYIPRGMLTLIEADPGVGKSFIAAAFATAISHGVKIPFGDAPFPKGVTLMYATEDSSEHTTVPRLKSFGCDLTKVEIIEDVLPLDRNGLDRLRNDIIETGAILCTIDPISAFIDAVTKSPRPGLDTHAIMTGVKRIAEETGCAIFGIRHMRKSSSQDSNAIYSGIGDISIAGKARSILQVRRDLENKGQCLITHVKSNVGPLGETVAYELRASDSPRGMANLLWLGSRDYDPLAEAMKQVGARGDKAVTNCEEWIRRKIGVPGGMYRSDELERLSTEAGYSRSTYNRAVKSVTKSQRIGDAWWRILLDPFEGEE